MKYLKSLLVAASMLLPMSVWAQGAFNPGLIPVEKSYINLYYYENAENKNDNGLYLAQEKGDVAKCTAGESGMFAVSSKKLTCVASTEITTTNTVSKIIPKLLSGYWDNKTEKYHSSKILLATDIDFKQKLNTTGMTWSCLGTENYEGMGFSGKVFDGNDKKISNVCGVVNAGEWKNGIGLFKSISGGTVKNLKLDSVEFVVLNIKSGSGAAAVSSNEEDYGPVGGLAAYIENSTVDNISLGYINVSAPFAGGLAGYIVNTPVTNISMIDAKSKIVASNDIVLKTNKTDSKMGGFKTVLGGLVGTSYSSSFSDIDIYPETIKNDVESDSSVLGGIAGLFVYADPAVSEKDVKIKNITVGHSSNSSIKLVTMLGGTTMGGLFGKTERKTETPSAAAHPSDLLINNVVVKRIQIENSSVSSSANTHNVYMGGLIGNSGLCNGGVLKFANSVTVDFLISENTTVAGTYQYYVGGLAGYAGCESTGNSSDRKDQYLSLANSHASGLISIDGGYNAKKTGDFFISASVGGLVGTAMFASENGIVNDTSSVDIAYKAKSTPASITKPEVASVTIGGVVGAASLYTSGIPLELEHIIAEGISSGSMSANIDVEDDGFNASVGGIIGEFPHNDNGGDPSISFYDVAVSSLTGARGALISYGGSGNAEVNTQSFMGGVCGKCKSVGILRRVSVKGALFRKTDAGGILEGKEYFYVGSLVGSTQLTSRPVKVYNTYSSGNISDFGGSSGYMFGLLAGATKENEFISNYHSGDDYVAAIGTMTGSGVLENVMKLSTLPSNMMKTAKVNVRNDNNGYFSASDGVMADADMKVQAFVDALNNAWPNDKSDEKIWVRKSEEAVFSDLYAVYFLDLDNHIYETKWTKKGGSVSIPAKKPAATEDGRCFAKWTMQSGNQLTDVKTNMTVSPESKTCEYTVTFNYYKIDGTEMSEVQSVKHGESASEPAIVKKTTDGWCFDNKWNKDFTNIVGELIVSAQYSKCKYTVIFVGVDGVKVLQKTSVTHGEDATPPTPPKITDKCFDKWDKSFKNVSADLTVYAKYEDGACVFDLTFVGPNGFKETKTFIEGGVTAPKAPEKNEKGECFVGWDPENYEKLTEDGVVTAQYGACPVKTFPVTFNGLDGKPLKNVQDKDGNHLDNPQIVEEGKSAVVPKDPNPVNGLCFAGWSKDKDDDYTNVTKELTVSAISKTCEYTVTFTYRKKDGTPAEKSQTVEYNKSATPPSNDDIPKTDDGQCFDGWDADYSKITDDLTVPAKYKTCVYTVKFMYTDSKGVFHVEKTESVEHGKSATAPDVPKKMDNLCFVSWNPSFSNVTGKLDVTAKYDICKYTVTFVYVDADGTQAEKVETVEYGKEVTGPNDVAKKNGDLCFAGWKGDLTNVTSDMTLEPEYKPCEVSSSSVAESSSSVVQSSSSVKGSSSSVVQSSSSAKTNSSSSVIQSSSSKAESSSSSAHKSLVDVAAPTVKQDGSALRMEFDNKVASTSGTVDCHIQVISDAGAYLDTVVTGKLVDKAKNGTWRLDPAPVGEYSVNFTFTNGEDSVTYKKKFTAPNQKKLAVHPWQLLSLYAFCYGKDDNCKSELESRLNQDHASASVYWWDESNPVGDYWQYRKFSANDKFDSTLGYWYGTSANEPLSLSLQTPDMNAEIVWKLQNRYSGWNLVANPYGWYVKLPQKEGVRFSKWDPEASEYVPADTLGPYEAVWVHADKTTEYRIPLKAAIVLEGEKKSLNKSAASEDWNLRVVLSDNNGKRDSWNELAVGNSKSLSEPPSGMGDRVNLSIVDGKQRLAKSVKQRGDDLEWNLEASATTSRAGHLSFVGLESVLAKGFRVYATVGDEMFEVTNDKPLDVQLSSKAKNVSVRVTKNAVSMNIAKNWLSGFRVNQTPNVLNVGFDAASKLAGANVKVSVVGIDGRVVASNRAVASEGSNILSMKKPKQGIYFVRVQVGSQSATKRILVH